jgi:hypothetical protein
LLARLTGICVACALVCCAAAGTARAATWWHPPQNLTWYWQLTGTPAVEPVDATDVDGFDTSSATVAAFHARGQHMICYIDVGTGEDWRPDYSSFPPSVLGSSNGWPGELWLDVRQLSVLEPIMTARFQMCREKGFDAVEPDNMDGYENNTGFPISASDQLAYDEWIAQEVHSLGMAVLQKNDPDQAASLEPYFDGALDEQCNQDAECSEYGPYLAAGKPVLNAEYEASLYPGFCAADDAAGIMGALYDTALDGLTYDPCFGPSVTTPGSPTSSASGHSGGLDRTAPRVGIGAARLELVHGGVAVKLTCPRGQSYCDGRLGLQTLLAFATGAHHRRRPLTLGSRAFRLSGGHALKLTVKLAAASLRRLRGRRSVDVVITVQARDRARRSATTRRRVVLALGRRG